MPGLGDPVVPKKCSALSGKARGRVYRVQKQPVPPGVPRGPGNLDIGGADLGKVENGDFLPGMRAAWSFGPRLDFPRAVKRLGSSRPEGRWPEESRNNIPAIKLQNCLGLPPSHAGVSVLFRHSRCHQTWVPCGLVPV